MPRVPVVEISPVGEVFIATEADRSSGIDVALAGKRPVFAAGNFEVLAHPSTVPHTRGEHTVLWLNRQGKTKPSPWAGETLADLAKDSEFWQYLEPWLQQRRREYERQAWVYFYVGFLPRTEPVFRDGVVHVGLQSQERLHIHIAEELSVNGEDRQLDIDNQVERKQLGRFLNVGGEESIYHQGSWLKDFGRQIILKQSLDDKVRLRTAYAFSSLSEAFPAVVQLQKNLAGRWLEHAKAIAGSQVILAGHFFTVAQSAVPNFMVILPSELDRRRLGVKVAEPVWVIPFSTASAPEILTPGGVVLDRRVSRSSHPPAQEHSGDHPLNRQNVGGLSVR